MRTIQERIEILHHRAAEIRKQKEKRKLTAAGCVSACLFVILAAFLAQTNGLAECVTENRFAGASMLSAGTGGYVLVAVLSFAAAVVITVICMKWKKRNQKEKDIKNEQQDPERDDRSR